MSWDKLFWGSRERVLSKELGLGTLQIFRCMCKRLLVYGQQNALVLDMLDLSKIQNLIHTESMKAMVPLRALEPMHPMGLLLYRVPLVRSHRRLVDLIWVTRMGFMMDKEKEAGRS